MAYPDPPDFPNITNQADFDLDWYTEVASYITAMNTDMARLSGDNGYIDLAADKSIEFGGTQAIWYSGGNVTIDKLEVDDDFANTTLSPGGDVSADTFAQITNLTLSGNLTVVGAIQVDTITDDSITIAQIAEPDDPPDGDAVIWCSNGTGYGDVGDICMKITETTTKSKTLIDFSTL